MTIYRVRAETVSRFEILVKARSPAEARRIARSTEKENPKWEFIDSDDYMEIFSARAVQVCAREGCKDPATKGDQCVFHYWQER